MTDNTRPMRFLPLLAFLLLAACGQSGDLYLPPNDPDTKPAEPAPPAVGPAADAEKDKK
jgi:predicted small lipoprotein YifL